MVLINAAWLATSDIHKVLLVFTVGTFAMYSNSTHTTLQPFHVIHTLIKSLLLLTTNTTDLYFNIAQHDLARFLLNKCWLCTSLVRHPFLVCRIEVNLLLVVGIGNWSLFLMKIY